MLITRLNKIRQLSADDLRLYLQAVLLLPVVHVSLSLLGFARLYGVMKAWRPLNFSRAPVSEAEVYRRASEISRMVSIAAQHGFYKATCLRRSMLAWWFLRREGIESHICFGVRLSDRSLKAHAWVERDGMILNDSANVREQYQALYEAPPPGQLGL